MTTQSVQAAPRGTLSTIIQMANPIFILFAVGVPIAALVIAQVSGSYCLLKYTHIMTGTLWTGIDLFAGFVLGPVVGGMEPKDRAGVFMRLMPKMTFLMPVIAAVSSIAGWLDAEKLGLFSLGNPWIVAALVVSSVLFLQGFGLLLPNEIRIFRELLATRPDVEKISRLGMRNAKLSGIQGVFQLAIIFIMVNLRY